MYRYEFKIENQLTPKELKQLEELLVPLFSWSYHFSQSFNNYHTLYFSSKPTWRLLLYDDNDLVGSLSIVKRKIINPFHLTIGGVGNVGIKQSHQGKGLAIDMLRKSHDFMKKQKIDFSLLFCAEKLINVYLKAGYIQIDKPVTYFSEGKIEEEPISLFYPLSLNNKQSNNIQQQGLYIKRGSW